MKSRGGYTIIEVIVVLAVTSILFVAATTIFGSQRGGTQFSQSVQDLQSKIESIGTAVASGAAPNGTSYSCSTSSGRPVLDTSRTTTLGTNGDCILLGRAVEATTGSGTIKVYTVLGTRDVYNGSTDTGATATTVSQANPTPALDTSGANVWLDTYTLGGGLTVQSTTSNLVGLYNSLESSGSVTALAGLSYTSHTATQTIGRIAFNSGLVTGVMNRGVIRGTLTSGNITGTLIPRNTGGPIRGLISAGGAQVVGTVTANFGVISGRVSPIPGISNYNIVQNVQGSIDDTDIVGCIEGPACSSSNLTQWNLCVQSGGGSQTALLSFNISPGGVTTNVKYGSCA